MESCLKKLIDFVLKAAYVIGLLLIGANFDIGDFDDDDGLF